MTDADLYLYGGFALAFVAVIVGVLEVTGGWWIIQERLGKKIDVPEGKGAYAKNKDMPIKLYDENHNLIHYSLMKPTSPDKYDLMGENGIPFDEVDLTKGAWWLNHRNFVIGKGANEIVLQMVKPGYAARLKDDLDAMHISEANATEEIMHRAKSIRSIREHDAETESNVYLKRTRGKRFMQARTQGKKKEEQQPPADDEVPEE